MCQQTAHDIIAVVSMCKALSVSGTTGTCCYCTGVIDSRVAMRTAAQAVMGHGMKRGKHAHHACIVGVSSEAHHHVEDSCRSALMCARALPQPSRSPTSTQLTPRLRPSRSPATAQPEPSHSPAEARTSSVGLGGAWWGLVGLGGAWWGEAG